MTDLFYTDLRQYTESMIAQLGGVFFDEQIWDRVQNINAYYREHRPTRLPRPETGTGNLTNGAAPIIEA